jgi:hypothetical protein
MTDYISQILSGQYTPQTVATLNVSLITIPGPWCWTRIGNTVLFSGIVTITPTAGATFTLLSIQLPPVPSSLAINSNPVILTGVRRTSGGAADLTGAGDAAAPGFASFFFVNDASVAALGWNCHGAYFII